MRSKESRCHLDQALLHFPTDLTLVFTAHQAESGKRNSAWIVRSIVLATIDCALFDLFLLATHLH